MNTENKYKYILGGLHSRTKVTKDEEYIEIVLKTHEYLQSLRIDDKDGIYWAKPGKENGDGAIYTGSAGVLYFYIELYKLTKDEKYLEIINKAADYIDINWKKAGEAGVAMLLEYGITEDLGTVYNYYSGAASTGEGLISVYQLTKRQKDKDAVREMTDFILDNAKKDENGLYWGIDCTMFHNAGTMIFLYHAAEFLQDEHIKEVASKAADRIVANAIKDPRGGYAWTSTLHAGVDRVPNFEGGTAGTGYALTVAYRYTRNEAYKNAAKEAAKHLRAIAVKQGEGYLIPWHDTKDEEPIFYLANCHGPAGTSKLFYGLYQITGDEEYLDDIKKLYYGMRHLGAPEKMSAGCWNTVCVCCGTAGILQFLINCGIVFNNTAFADEIDTVAKLTSEIIVGEQETKIGGRLGVWPIAYERVKPQNISPDFGYSIGASGIAATLLQYYQYKKKDINFGRYIDDPYPTNVKLK
jgi:lantibiotic modifying enzyme